MNISRHIALLSCTLLMLLQGSIVLAAGYDRAECESDRIYHNTQHPDAPYPDFFCPCIMDNIVFDFPIDTVLTDTVWYQASVEQLKHGLGAFWFSDSRIGMECYASCASPKVVLGLNIGANRMREMSEREIKEKLQGMDATGTDFDKSLVYMRIYPQAGDSGRVIVYPYDMGPHSTCEDPLPLHNGMTMISSHSEDVYVLAPSNIKAGKQAAIQWKGRNNESARLYVTRGRCEGASPLVDITLVDSTKLFYPSVELLDDCKTSGDSLYIHIEHDDAVVGRLTYWSNPKFFEFNADTTLCKGKSWEIHYNLRDTLLRESTFMGPDTCWMVLDSIGIYNYNLTVTEPDTLRDTLRVRAANLPITYKKTILVQAGGYGDYLSLYQEKNECQQWLMLHVEHIVDTIENTIDTTTCVGKSIKINGTTYTTDTVSVIGKWESGTAATCDTWLMTNLNIHFEMQPIVYDTLEAVRMADIQAGKVTYTYNSRPFTIQNIGDTLITCAFRNTCTQEIQLHIPHRIDTVNAEIDETFCDGQSYQIGDSTYTSDINLRDSVAINIDTLLVTHYTIGFVMAEMEFDTIYVMAKDTPYTYMDTEIAQYGDTIIHYQDEEGCNRLTQVTMIEQENIDTGNQNTNAPRRATKKLINGELILEVEGRRYSILGLKIED